MEPLGAQPAQHLEAVDAGQADVEDDEIRRLAQRRIRAPLRPSARRRPGSPPAGGRTGCRARRRIRPRRSGSWQPRAEIYTSRRPAMACSGRLVRRVPRPGYLRAGRGNDHVLPPPLVPAYFAVDRVLEHRIHLDEVEEADQRRPGLQFLIRVEMVCDAPFPKRIGEVQTDDREVQRAGSRIRSAKRRSRWPSPRGRRTRTGFQPARWSRRCREPWL